MVSYSGFPQITGKDVLLCTDEDFSGSFGIQFDSPIAEVDMAAEQSFVIRMPSSEGDNILKGTSFENGSLDLFKNNAVLKKHSAHNEVPSNYIRNDVLTTNANVTPSCQIAAECITSDGVQPGYEARKNHIDTLKVNPNHENETKYTDGTGDDATSSGKVNVHNMTKESSFGRALDEIINEAVLTNSDYGLRSATVDDGNVALTCKNSQTYVNNELQKASSEVTYVPWKENAGFGETDAATAISEEPEMNGNFIVCAYPRDQIFGSQYVALDTLGCERQYADFLSFGPSLNPVKENEETVCDLYIDDYFSGETNASGPSRRPIQKEDLPMGINREYVLIHKVEFAELLKLREENTMLLSKLTDKIVDAVQNKVSPGDSMDTQSVSRESKRRRKDVEEKNVKPSRPNDDEDEQQNSDDSKDPDYVPTYRSDEVSSSRGISSTRKKRSNRKIDSSVVAQIQYNLVLPEIVDQSRLIHLFRLEFPDKGQKNKPYTSKTDRNMIRLFLGTAKNLAEAFSTSFWKQEWSDKKLISVKRSQPWKPKILCDKMRRLVAEKYPRGSRTSENKSRFGARTVLEKRLHVIGFSHEEVKLIAKAMDLAMSCNCQTKKACENVVTSIHRGFLAEYFEKQLAASEEPESAKAIK